MRRVCQIAAFAVLLQGLSVSPTYAWWDDVEHMSGPGPFFGWDIQLRLFCVVKPVDSDKSEVRTSGPVGAILSVCRVRHDDRTKEKKDKELVMFDIGARFLRTTKYEDQLEDGVNPDFAHGKRIHFTTLEPAVMFPVAEKDWLRVDYGFGAGLYWLSSEDFESQRGTLIEPIRLDFRIGLPKAWKVDAAVFRFGLLNFPAGFNFAEFNGIDGHDGRVSSDWVRSYALFVDLTRVADAWTQKLKR
jgi:hypothetical protein